MMHDLQPPDRARTARGLVGALALLLALAVGRPAAAAEEAAGPALGLVECIELGLRANQALSAVRAGRTLGEARIRTAGALPNPELDGDWTTSAPHPGFLVRQSLPLWSRRAAIGVATAELAETDLGIAASALELRHAVRRHFGELLHAERARELGALALESAAELEQATRARYDAGDVPELELKLTRLGSLRVRSGLADADSEERTARAALNLDLGRSPEAPLRLAGALAERPELPATEALLARALEEGRDMRALRQQQAIASARLGLAEVQARPSLELGAGVELNDPECSIGPQFSVTLGLPLFDRRQGERAEARAELRQLELEAQALSARLAGALATGFERVRAADQRIALLEGELVPSAQQVLALHQEAYREGSIGILNVVEAQRTAREVEGELARALLDWHSAVADLELEAGLELPAGGHP